MRLEEGNSDASCTASTEGPANQPCPFGEIEEMQELESALGQNDPDLGQNAPDLGQNGPHVGQKTLLML